MRTSTAQSKVTALRPFAPNTKPVPMPPDVGAASFMRLPAVVVATGVSKGTAWNWSRKGKFPQPVRFEAITAWRSADVLTWLNDPNVWHASQRAEG
ncbi:AlpA family phage regulatory protein [Bordetella petrii]|uniref:helix-turn-helix transcriptional regulator n=1 Tax=Bordetella petrii TaxID=94624 RepID=UPI001A95C9B0|nr:AlpA family phage regulatory protein [Bordetella petrii]